MILRSSALTMLRAVVVALACANAAAYHMGHAPRVGAKAAAPLKSSAEPRGEARFEHLAVSAMVALALQLEAPAPAMAAGTVAEVGGEVTTSQVVEKTDSLVNKLKAVPVEEKKKAPAPAPALAPAAKPAPKSATASPDDLKKVLNSGIVSTERIVPEAPPKPAAVNYAAERATEQRAQAAAAKEAADAARAAKPPPAPDALQVANKAKAEANKAAKKALDEKVAARVAAEKEARAERKARQGAAGK